MIGEAPWRRRGLVFAVRAGHPWWASHAQAPTVLPLADDLWRVYFGARTAGNRSHIVSVDVDPSRDMRVVDERLKPVLDCGPPGSFDREGMGPAAVLVVDGQVRLYYTGVVVRRDVRITMAIGLALSDDGGVTFRRAFNGPVLGPGPCDPFFTSTPAVIPASDGFRMYYSGGEPWREVDEAPDFFYGLRSARSADGLFWDPRTRPSLELQADDAGLTRPSLLQEGERLRLWFSQRGAHYRGEAPGAYRLMSTLSDEVLAFTGARTPVRFANPPQPGDFDGQMQAYAHVVPHRGDLIMLYNGDGFGVAGFGWAKLDASDA